MKEVLQVVVPANAGVVQLRLLTATGQVVVRRAAAGGTITISAASLSSGMYLLQVMNRNGVLHSQKVLKE